MNCDGRVNSDDVPPFVRALLDPADYRAQFPSCNLYNADLNADGTVDGNDIGPFLAAIIP